MCFCSKIKKKDCNEHENWLVHEEIYCSDSYVGSILDGVM